MEKDVCNKKSYKHLWQCSLCESCDSKNRGMTYKVQSALYNKKGTM